MSDRCLVSIKRVVPPWLQSAYDPAWAELRAAVKANGANAWRFRSAGTEDHFMEFLEFAAGADPRERPEVAEALRRLSHAFPAPPGANSAAEEWREA